MNALLVEQAWLTATAAIYAPLAGYCGTNADVIPNEDPIVVFLCEECQHKAGKYWTALLKIEVDAPAMVEGTQTTYSSVWTDLLAWLADKALVEAAFPSENVDLNGYFVRTSGQGMRDNRWIASIELLVGVSTAGA